MADGNTVAVTVQPVKLPSSVDMEAAAYASVIERAARDETVPIERLEKLYEFQRRVRSDAAERAFLEAISQLQAELPTVARKGKGHNNDYARFEDIIDAIRPVLVKHGFSLTFRTAQTEKAITVTGVLGHREGHKETTDVVLPPDTGGSKNVVQAWGSSTSYGKRYVTLTLLGIATEKEDDDGNKAVAKPAEANTVETLKKLIEDTKTDIGKVCAHYSVEGLDDLTAKQIAEAIAGLSARKRQQQVKK